MSVAVKPRGRDPYPVYSAVSTASVDQVSQLLKQGHSPDKSLPGIPSPLYRAVRFNRPDVALALIRAGCDVKPMSKKQQLHYPPVICLAAHLNQTEVVLELCKNTLCQISATNDQLQTIVHLAVLRKNYDLVQRLPWHCLGRKLAASVANNVQLYCFLNNFATMPDGQFITPLQLAASLGDLTMLKLLLRTQTFFKLFKTHLTPLLSSKPDKTKTCTGEKLKPCPEDGVDSNCTSECEPQVIKPSIAISCLGEKCASLPNSCSLTDSASRFRDSSGTVGTAGRRGTAGTALSMDDKLNRCVAHCSSTVKTDCQRDSNSIASNNASTCECDHPACSSADKDAARKQLINQRMLGSKDTLLHFAARGQHLEVMEFLLGEGAEVNLQNSAGNTALHLLCMQGRATHRAVAAARLLLMAGADCNLKGSIQQPMKAYNNTRNHSLLHPQPDQRGLTVAMIAAMRNRVAYLKLLSEFGAGFDEVNEVNMTTLMMALTRGQEEAVLFLLTHHPEEARFHAWVDNMGYTTLHYVSYCKSKAGQLTERLLAEGYEVVRGTPPSSCPCSRGTDHTLSRVSYKIQSPLIWSIRQRQFAVVQALVRHQPDLLTSPDSVTLSPLHAVLAYILGKQCALFIDFLLAHGADGNAVVCGRTPYELAALMFGQDVESGLYGAAHLRERLGSVFLLPDLAHSEDHKRRMAVGGKDGVESVSRPALRPREHCVKVLSLRDACCSLVRQSVRKTRGNYHAQITSLPLPGRVIDYLLFKTVV